MLKFGVGQSATRLEDQRLLTGRGTYTSDINLDVQAYGVVVRSPHAHARFSNVDTTVARAAPGVLAVYTSDDIKAAGLKSIQFMTGLENVDGSPVFSPTRDILAIDVIRHAGHPVAFVVAETLGQARDAAELVDIDYEALPSITDTGRATEDGAPQVWDGAPNNVGITWQMGDREGTDAAFEKAEYIVRVELVNNRVVVNSMETRAAVGQWDGKRFTLYTPSQGVHFIQSEVAEILGVKVDGLRVVTNDIGGSFGMKTMIYAEQPLVLLAARDLDRPVKWVSDRTEAFVSDNHGRDQVNRAELALDSDACFTGVRVRSIGNFGAFYSSFGMYIPTVAGAGLLGGVYTVPAIHVEVRGVFTHTVSTDAYRGAGRPEAIYVIERLVDAAARQLKIDPVELRRRNMIPKDAMPYTTAMQNAYDRGGIPRYVYDSGDFPRMMETALKRADYDGFAARRDKARRAGKLRGLGLTTFVESSGGYGGSQKAAVSVDDKGDVSVVIGAQAMGQGMVTGYTQVIAENLGVENERVNVIIGDTDLVWNGTPDGRTSGSRGMPIGGVACERAALTLIENGKRIAADVLEASATDIDFAEGEFSVVGTDRRVGLAQVAEAAKDPKYTADGEEPGLSGNGEFTTGLPNFPNGCYVCEVEIDRETGTLELVRFVAFDDIGTVVNPLLAGGQTSGSIVQGIGQAVHEGCIYDPESGQLLSGSYMDYCMPRADDLPAFEMEFVQGIPSINNPMGMKGAGESGCVGAPPAVVSAVLNALSEFNVSAIDMPITQEKIWRLMNGNAQTASN
jgi:carbon-monoxide dehydrogenase large subunit